MKLIDYEAVRRVTDGIEPMEYMKWVDAALKKKESFLMPAKITMRQVGGDGFGVMPCLWKEENLAMVKMLGRHTVKEGENRPVMMGDILLYEADSGILKAVMDAEYITTLRTGAIAAHSAIKYGKRNFTTIGLIGLGNIMAACMDVLLPVLKERELIIKLYKYKGQEERFCKRYRNYHNIKFVLCDTYDDTVRNSDLVVSAVTRVEKDFCPDSCYAEGCTVIPVMTMGFQNCDLFFDQVFTDDIDQIRGFRYFNSFKSVKNTNEVLLGKVVGRINDQERILVYNYGLAIHDMYFAKKIYELTREKNEVKYEYCKEKYFMKSLT